MYYIWIIAAVIFLLDRITKLLVISNISLGTSWPVIHNFFYLSHVQNQGAAFGLFAGGTPYFIVFTLVVGCAAALLLRKMISHLTKPIAICLGLIIGGALGNFVDRVYWGYVVDFLNFNLFPFVFNLADSALVVGSFMLAGLMFFGENTKAKKLEMKGTVEAVETVQAPETVEAVETVSVDEEDESGKTSAPAGREDAPTDTDDAAEEEDVSQEEEDIPAEMEASAALH
ncbi:MAG: signal peptidase II [Peptococcaceae bacterium]|nr:signal peptidase II [Peptococcaceae bacterium]